MKRILKPLLAVALTACMAFLFCFSGYAVTSTDCGIRLVRNSNYTSDGKFYESFKITSGRPPNTAEGGTLINAKVVNASGTTVFAWKEYDLKEYETATRSFGADYSNQPSGTYTFFITLTSYGREYGYVGGSKRYNFTWRYTINHTQPSTISINSVENIYSDDGYLNKIILKHKGAKGMVANVEIYDEYGSMVFKKSGNPISYTSGSYNFYWDGFPTNGGTQCQSGNYTIKYWLGGKGAKQSSYYLSIY